MSVQDVVESYLKDSYQRAPSNPSKESQFNQRYKVEECSFLWKGLSDGSYMYSDVVVCPRRLSEPVDYRPSVAQKDAVQGTLATVTAAAVSNVAANIGARFSSLDSGVTLTLAGQRLALNEAAANLASFDDGRARVVGHRLRAARTRAVSRGLNFEELLRTSAFEISLGAAEGESFLAGRWTVWGRGDVLFFDDDSDSGGRYDGDLKAGYLGLDAWVDDRWLAGVAASRIVVDSGYSPEGTTTTGGWK